MTTSKSRFNLRLTTPDDLHLETYDHTKLSAVNTCPTWGILRYQMHKKMPGSGRSMALEAGGAMHECFSFIRLVTLMDQYEGKPDFQDMLWNYHGTRLFGDRLDTITGELEDATDLVEVAKRGCITVLDTSGFYDDPRDKRRTLSNLEECIYAYINRWRWDQPVWMRDPSDATSDVGIEIPFDVVIHIEAEQDELMFRLTGRIDGIHYSKDGSLYISDNKTSSRLNDAWSQSFLLSHQMTGYCVAASVFTQHLVHKAEILGLAIPLPKTYDLGGYVRETVPRHDYHYVQWAKWLEHTVRLTREYANDPINAPKFTHSCNRYFQPCSMIPFCDNNEEEQQVILKEMLDEEWSPLAKPILEGVGSE